LQSTVFFCNISLLIHELLDMEVIKINHKKPEPQVVKKAADIIKSGGLIIMPTETVYAIFGDALDREVLEKIFQLKQRNPVKRFDLTLYPHERIYDYVEYNLLIPKILAKFPKLPISFGLPRKPTLPPFLNSGFDIVSFHFFFSQLDKELFKYIDTPLIGTSANISGQPDVSSVEKVIRYFRPIFGTPLEPGLILDGGKLAEKSPSAIIELTDEGIKVIRGGGINVEKLQKKLDKFVKEINVHERIFNKIIENTLST
jgi:L-threonylcarbamoyladenylate synthase